MSAFESKANMALTQSGHSKRRQRARFDTCMGIDPTLQPGGNEPASILCVPKTPSVLIGEAIDLTSVHNDRAAMFQLGYTF